MKIEVKLKDGTTMLWLESRGDLTELVRRDPDRLEARPADAADGPRRARKSVRVLVRWHPESTGDMEIGHFQALNRTSISYVRELTAAEQAEFEIRFARALA